MNNISIVLGYGVFIKPMPEYQQYLETILKDIVNRQSNLIITCASCSNKNYPKLSEAESIKNIFLEFKPELKSSLITETKSLSTPESLEFCKQLIAHDYPESKSITVYCDSCRTPKVLYLALSLFTKQTLTQKDKLMILGDICRQRLPDVSKEVVFNYQNITVVGVPLSNNMTLIAHQIMSSMLEMHAFDYPDLHRQFIDWRKKQWGIN